MATPSTQVIQEPGRLFQFNRPSPGEPPISQLIRDLFTALARNNWTTDPSFPLTEVAQDGMTRVMAQDPNNVKFDIFVNGAWHTFMQQVQLGFPAPAKKIIEFDAPVVGDVWTIDHNLGTQPLVQVFDATYTQKQCVPSSPGVGQYILQHATPNRTLITNQPSSNSTGFVIFVG